MPGTLIMLAAALLSPPADTSEAVQRAVREAHAPFDACFVMHREASGDVSLRFVIDARGRARDVEVEESNVDSVDLEGCLINAVKGVEFPAELAGSEVVYPVRVRSAEIAEPQPAARRRGPRLRLVEVERTLGDTWLVLDGQGEPMSDLDLALAASAPQVLRRLQGARRWTVGLLVLESVLAAGGLAAGGYGLHRSLTRDDAGDLDLGLAVGGGALAAVAGSLLLYHLVRAFDYGAGRPFWHHLDRAEALSLVSRVNAP